MTPYFKLDNQIIKTPQVFKVERYKITKSNRLANADMSMEYINKKLKFFLTWNVIEARQLDALLAILWNDNKVFWKFDYLHNGQQKSCTVYVGMIPAELHLADKDGWVWKDVEIHLIER